MTSEQKNAVRNYLLAKKLPIDLLVEIEDHMTEQIDCLMKDNCLDFDVAFQQSQNNWKDDLRLCFSFSQMKHITNFQKKISKATRKIVLQKALVYFLPFILISLFLLFYNKEYAYYYFLTTFILIAIAIGFLAIHEYRIMKNTGNMGIKNISYLQKSAGILVTASFCIPMFIIRNYNVNFDSFYQSFQNVLHGEIAFNDFMNFSFFYVYIFASVVGFFYFIEYKKVIKILERKIGLKL